MGWVQSVGLVLEEGHTHAESSESGEFDLCNLLRAEGVWSSREVSETCECEEISSDLRSIHSYWDGEIVCELGVTSPDGNDGRHHKDKYELHGGHDSLKISMCRSASQHIRSELG